MKNILIIRSIFESIIAFIILIWAFFNNQLVGKIIISPFLICSVASFGKNLCLLLNKEKIANIFKYIFRINFFVYAFGFLIYAIYYAIVNKVYSLFIIIGIFIIGIIKLLKNIK